MEFRHLEIFIKLVENLSFSATALELNISQPTVSLTLKQLEEVLDTPLFLRSTRELKITDAGKQLYDDAIKLLKQREKVVEKFIYSKRKIITIGASTIPAAYILPSIIAEFKSLTPNVITRVEEKNSYEIIKKVSANTVDVGIVGMKPDDENCDFMPICNDEFVFIAANNTHYRNLKKSEPSIAKLAEEPLIVRESGSAIKKYMELLLESEGVNIGKLNITASINDTEVIKHLTVQGLGISFLSKIAVTDMIKAKQLITFELNDKPYRYREIYIVWNKKITHATHIKDFLNCVENYKNKTFNS